MFLNWASVKVQHHCWEPASFVANCLDVCPPRICTDGFLTGWVIPGVSLSVGEHSEVPVWAAGPSGIPPESDVSHTSRSLLTCFIKLHNDKSMKNVDPLGIRIANMDMTHWRTWVNNRPL